MWGSASAGSTNEYIRNIINTISLTIIVLQTVFLATIIWRKKI